MKKIFENIAIAAGWVLAIMVFFGGLFIDSLRSGSIIASLSILLVYAIYKYCTKEVANDR